MFCKLLPLEDLKCEYFFADGINASNSVDCDTALFIDFIGNSNKSNIKLLC